MLARATFLVEDGDMSGALRELAELRGRPKLAVSAWVEQMSRRLRMEQAERLVSAGSLLRLAELV